MIDAILNRVRETQALGANVPVDEVFEPRLIDRNFSRLKGIHFPLVVIHANDVMADFSEASA